MAAMVKRKIGGVNLPLVVERDAVVSFADLETAVVVRLHTGRPAWIDDAVNLLDDFSANAVDSILVEGHDDGGHPGVLRHEVTANQVVAERAPPNVGRRCAAHVRDQPVYVEATVSRRFHNRRGRQAGDAFDGLDAFDVVADASDVVERVLCEETFRGVGRERDDQRTGAAEFLAESLVVLVHGIGLREPRGDVVVDVGDIGAGNRDDRAGGNERGQRDAPAVDPGRQPGAHAVPLTNSIM